LIWGGKGLIKGFLELILIRKGLVIDEKKCNKGILLQKKNVTDVFFFDIFGISPFFPFFLASAACALTW
jgi:hypothetical protein